MENTISSTLKTSSINVATLPTGVASITITPNNYQSVINTYERPVSISYMMNNGYVAPSSFTVSGSFSVIDNVSSSATITPINATAFNIPPKTLGNLSVLPASPSKINYNINAGTLPFGMNGVSFVFTASNVQANKYQIETFNRSISAVYVMNNGYSQPSGNIIITSGPATITNNRAFGIPINGYGDIVVTPNTISPITYSISIVNKPNGIGTATVDPSTYVINHTSNVGVGISFTANTG